MAQEKKSAVSTISSIMVITLFGKLLGLWRDRLLAIHYGTGMEANAFYTASRIPRVFFDAIFAAAVAACFIPVFAQYTQKEGEEGANKFASNFLSIIALLTFALTLIGIAFPEPLVTLFASGYDEETRTLATSLTRLLFPTVFLTGLAFSFVGILQGRDRFIIPALISAISNGIIIVYFYGLDHIYGIYGLAIAYLVGWLAQSLIQIPSLRAVHFRYTPSFSLKTEGMGQVFTLMGPVMVSTWVQPINLTINASFASHLHDGAGVSAIEIATNLYLILAGVFILSITNVIFPKLATLTAQGDTQSFDHTLQSTLHVSLFFMLPMSVGLAVVATPLITLVYGGGEFDQFSIQITAQALQWISFGMAGYGVQNVVSRACFAKGDGKSPLYAGITSIVVNLILSITLLAPYGVQGLAIASTASSTLYAILLVVIFQKQGGTILTPKLTNDLFKMLISSGLMGGLAMITQQLTQPYGALLSLLLTAMVGAITYGILTLLLKLEEITTLLRWLKPSN